MKRRAFLGALGTALAGAVLDPERALWIPGERKIFDLGGIRPATTYEIVSVSTVAMSSIVVELWTPTVTRVMRGFGTPLQVGMLLETMENDG